MQTPVRVRVQKHRLRKKAEAFSNEFMGGADKSTIGSFIDVFRMELEGRIYKFEKAMVDYGSSWNELYTLEHLLEEWGKL